MFFNILNFVSSIYFCVCNYIICSVLSLQLHVFCYYGMYLIACKFCCVFIFCVFYFIFQIPPSLEIGLVPPLKKGQYPGLFLMTTPARMLRPVLNLATNTTELIGSFEQASLIQISFSFCFPISNLAYLFLSLYFPNNLVMEQVYMDIAVVADEAIKNVNYPTMFYKYSSVNTLLFGYSHIYTYL